MNQHKLYRTIQSLGDVKVRTEDQLLRHVLANLITNEAIPINGARIWKLEPASGTYRLLHQVGEMEAIDKKFRIRVLDYPLFLNLPRKGTIVGTETNRYLLRKGIKHYSATGVGEKIAWKTYTLYQYVLGVNAEYMKEDLIYALNIIGNALSAALSGRRMESKAKLLEQDLDKAREIQQSILPLHEFKFFNYDLYGVSLPDRVVGGDFFDYLQTPEDKDRLGIVIADAASKGLSAAAQALFVSGAIRMGIQYQTKLSTLIQRVNMLVHQTFTTEHFVSMVYAELTNSDNGLVFYVNAGHSNPILLKAATNEVKMLQATGQLLGPFPGEKYRTEYTTMERGDVLLFYTDGISEAADGAGEMYGEQRIVRQLRENKSRTPREICQRILEDVQIHNRLIEYSDDKTVVVIKRTR